MVRTKKHFRPPSPSSSGSSSSSEDEDVNVSAPLPRGGGKQLQFMGSGGGKQLSVVGGGFRGGKQLMAPQEESEESSSSESEEEPSSKQITYSRPGGGKQLRVPGGKQLRAAAAAEDDEEESDSEEEDEEEEKVVYRPGGGKQFGGKAFRGGKQLVRPPSPEMDEDSDSSSDEEEEVAPTTTTVVQRGQGGGKQLRMPAPADDKKEESADDMEESEEDEEEEPPAPPPAKASKPAAKPKPAPVPAPEPEESSSEEEIVAPKRRGRPPASTRPTRSTRSTKKVVDSSSEEDEDDDDSSEEEFELDMETFDNNKLIKDEADRKMLDKMPELEREAILAERFEKLKADADMKKAMRDVKRKEKEQKKQTKPKSKTPKKRAPPKKEPPKKRGRRAAAKKEESESSDDDQDEDYDEGVPDTSGDAALAASMSGKRVSTRNLDAKGNKFKIQAALSKIRVKLANKAATKDDESNSDLDYGKDSDDSDDDYEESTMLKPWQQKKNRKATQLQQESSGDESMDERREKESSKKRYEDVDADVEDFALVTIPRRRLIRWCNEPFFEKAVKDCYIRLGIGRDAKTQKACYRLCRVVGVESKKEYSFPPDANQKPVTTDKWLKVSFGKAENMFKMLTISDHRPTLEDVKQYVSQLKTDRLTDNMLLKKKAVKLRKRQDNLVNNYTYTQEDIEKLVTEKKKRNKKSSNIGLEKTHIAIAVQAAKDAVREAESRIEQAKIQQMEAEDAESHNADSNLAEAKKALDQAKALLEERIEEQKRILKDEEDRINRLKGSSKVQNWVKVNQRARLANQNADFLSYKEQLAKEKAEASAEPKFDPFARRKVKPKNLWEVGGKQSSDKSADAGAVEEEKKDSHPSEDAAAKDAEKDKRDETAEAPKLDSTGQSAPFTFDDDINIGDIANLGLGLKKPVNRARKGISFADYLSRKEAGTL